MVLGTARSYVIALRVSRKLGQVNRLRGTQRITEALKVAHEGLALLRQAVVRRSEAAEGALLVALTVNAEQLAQELGASGASARDIEDSLAVLKRCEPNGSEAWTFRTHWLPYLEAKAAATKGAVQ